MKPHYSPPFGCRIETWIPCRESRERLVGLIPAVEAQALERRVGEQIFESRDARLVRGRLDVDRELAERARRVRRLRAGSRTAHPSSAELVRRLRRSRRRPRPYASGARPTEPARVMRPSTKSTRLRFSTTASPNSSAVGSPPPPHPDTARPSDQQQHEESSRRRHVGRSRDQITEPRGGSSGRA